MHAISMTRTVVISAVLVAATGVLTTTAAPAELIERPVDIRVEHDRSAGSAGPLVMQSGDEHPGPGPELTFASAVVDNPSGWDGNVLVDIDPDAKTITVEVESPGCYDDVLVRIGTNWMTSVATISDALFDPTGAPVTLTASLVEPGDYGAVVLHWVSENGDCPSLDVEGSRAVFSYEATFYAPLTVEPSEVRAGDPVTVSGTQCPDSPIEVRVLLFLSESVPHHGSDVPVVEAEAPGDAAGNWRYVIDTTDLEPGLYSVSSRCLLTEAEGFDYGEAGFMVLGSVAPPTEPVSGVPSFAG